MRASERLKRLEAAIKPDVTRGLLAGASDACWERFNRYMNDPAVPEPAKAEKILFIVGMMAKTRSEETMLSLIGKWRGVTDPAATLAEGRAVYQRLSDRMKAGTR